MIQISPREKTFGMTGCKSCICLEPCGGHPLPIVNKLGCVNYASRQRVIDTDDMNPHFEEAFWRYWNDIDGLLSFEIGSLSPISAARLPRYIPQIQNRYLKCAGKIETKIAAIPLFAVLKKKNGVYGSLYSTAKGLRNAFHLSHDTQILLVGVDEDPPIEQFWGLHRMGNPLDALQHLDLLGVTVPNFSFFTCVPRFQILRNRKRILLASERLSNAGLNVSPHLNALTPTDWDFWVQFLKSHPEVDVVTMEFQTGYRRDEKLGGLAFANLVDLQQRVGREIHPILVGAGRFYRAASAEFKNFSIVDSNPFMQALARERLVKTSAGRFEWVKSCSEEGEPLDSYINATLGNYEQKLGADDAFMRPVERDPMQGDWGWGI